MAKRYQINLELSIQPCQNYGGAPPLARARVLSETVPLGEDPTDYLFSRVEQEFCRVRDQMTEVMAAAEEAAEPAVDVSGRVRLVGE